MTKRLKSPIIDRDDRVIEKNFKKNHKYHPYVQGIEKNLVMLRRKIEDI